MVEAIMLRHINVQIGSKPILNDIQFHVEKGSMFGLIGPNGSGKSTLLKTIAKIQPYTNGTIYIDNAKQEGLSHRQLAKKISYVPQETEVGFDFLVRDVLEMGRHVHRSLFTNNSEQDEKVIQWAMEQTDTAHLQDESIRHLSGGQRQLVMIAKALIQDTPIILLDEPISALDVHYQLKVLTLLQRLKDKGKTIVIVLHDLNLAARYCETLLLMHKGKVEKVGRPKEVLTSSILKEIYHIDAYIKRNEQIDCLTITPYIKEHEYYA